MGKTIDAPTGRRNVFVRVLLLVQLRLEWPSHLVDRLPDDLTITLSGPDIPTQTKDKSGGVQQDDLVCFDFQWDEKTKSVKLEASGNGQSVVLWNEQVAGNLDADIQWEERLHPLLSDFKEVEVASEDTGSGTMADDLHYAEVADLMLELR